MASYLSSGAKGRFGSFAHDLPSMLLHKSPSQPEASLPPISHILPLDTANSISSLGDHCAAAVSLTQFWQSVLLQTSFIFTPTLEPPNTHTFLLKTTTPLSTLPLQGGGAAVGQNPPYEL